MAVAVVFGLTSEPDALAVDRVVVSRVALLAVAEASCDGEVAVTFG